MKHCRACERELLPHEEQSERHYQDGLCESCRLLKEVKEAKRVWYGNGDKRGRP